MNIYLKGVKDMLEENRDIIREAMQKMNEWNIYEFEETPDNVKLYRQMLEEFYIRNGNNPADPWNFNTRVKLSPEAEEELADLAASFVEDDTTDTDYFEDFFNPQRKEWRERYNINSMDDLINFLNFVNRYKNDYLIRSILSSDQIVELVTEASSKGLTEDDIYSIVYNEYSSTGNEGDDLYNQIWRSIDNYDPSKGVF